MKREEEKAKKEEDDKVGKILREPDHYAECYPGMTEMNDAIDDSDEEADYSKMDLVKKYKKINIIFIQFYFATHDTLFFSYRAIKKDQ